MSTMPKPVSVEARRLEEAGKVITSRDGVSARPRRFVQTRQERPLLQQGRPRQSQHEDAARQGANLADTITASACPSPPASPSHRHPAAYYKAGTAALRIWLVNGVHKNTPCSSEKDAWAKKFGDDANPCWSVGSLRCRRLACRA